MLVLVRRARRRLAFCDAMERDYFSLHFDDVSQPCADLSGQDGANAITSESNVNAKLGGRTFRLTSAEIAARVLNVHNLAG